jgi:hypothetical protein
MSLPTDLPIPVGHQLFRVEVEAEATQEKVVLVMAEDAQQARTEARRQVHFSSFDFDDWDITATARPTEAAAETDQDDLENDAYIVWPPNSRQDSEVNTRELLDLLLTPDAEAAERLRLARIEANNGQQPLPLSSPIAL